MTLAGLAAGAAFVAQIAGGPPDAVAAAYARAAETMPVAALIEQPRGRREVLAWQISCSELSATQRAVFHAILLHYNHERMDAWPSYQTIAEHAGCERRTAIAAVKELVRLGFLTIERRFRTGHRWPGRDRHRRTNVYRFADGRPIPAVAETPPEAAEGEPVQRVDSIAAPPAREPVAPISSPRAESAAPAPVRDPYWETFSSAFGAEYRRVYGSSSNPGSVSSAVLLGQAKGLLVEIISECDAWAQQRGLNVERTEIAQELSRRMASTWLSWSGRDDRLRERRHPIGWVCGDLQRLAYGRGGEPGAVESWKRTQKPVAGPSAVEDELVPASTEDIAKVRAEARALGALLSRGLSFEHAVALVRAESERLRAPPTGAGPPVL